jgi:hypothetical protein
LREVDEATLAEVTLVTVDEDVWTTNDDPTFLPNLKVKIQ